MKTKQEPVIIEQSFQDAVGKAVSYYLEGWRVGYLEGFTKMGAAVVRPMAALGGQKPHTKNVPLNDIKILLEGKDETKTDSTAVVDADAGGLPEQHELQSRKKRTRICKKQRRRIRGSR